MKAKLIWYEQSYDDDSYSDNLIARSIGYGEFEEISEQDFYKLRANLYKLKKPYPNFYPRLIILDDFSLPTRLADVQVIIDKEAEQAAQKAVDQKKKKQLADKKKQEKKKVLFEQLKKEFEK